MIITALLAAAGILLWLIVGERTASSMNYTSSHRWWAYFFLGPIVPITRYTSRWVVQALVVFTMMREDMASKLPRRK